MNTLRTCFAVFIFSLTLLSDLVFLLVPGMPATTSQQTALSDSLSDKILRLHIIADSDLEEAQAVKLLVRDAVCDYLSPLPDGIDSKKKSLRLPEPSQERPRICRRRSPATKPLHIPRFRLH